MFHLLDKLIGMCKNGDIKIDNTKRIYLDIEDVISVAQMLMHHSFNLFFHPSNFCVHIPNEKIVIIS